MNIKDKLFAFICLVLLGMLLLGGVGLNHILSERYLIEEMRAIRVARSHALQILLRDISDAAVENSELTARMGESLRDLSSDSLHGDGNSLAALEKGKERIMVVMSAIVVLAFVVLLLLAWLAKVVRGRLMTKASHNLLLRIVEDSACPRHLRKQVGEAAVALNDMMGDLHESLQVIQARIWGVDHDVGVLASNVQQMTMDQVNLFALNAAIEAARPQQDGFAMVASEICLLSGRATRLADDVRNMANQAQLTARKAVADLEWVARRIEFGQAVAGPKRVVPAALTLPPRETGNKA
ncbi:MAG: methyl-accepting chemotaxis protein [Azoarcus sp.]|jgi:methyl-accepting chemotaxis protein|nr:methyl-accepting chemotaxis protein [Azoarcus sp.]